MNEERNELNIPPCSRRIEVYIEDRERWIRRPRSKKKRIRKKWWKRPENWGPDMRLFQRSLFLGSDAVKYFPPEHERPIMLQMHSKLWEYTKRAHPEFCERVAKVYCENSKDADASR